MKRARRMFGDGTGMDSRNEGTRDQVQREEGGDDERGSMDR